MIWASWRQQRLQLLTLLGLVVVGAGIIFLVRSSMISDLDESGVAGCVARVEECAAPDQAVKAFVETWGDRLDVGRMLITVFPALIGVFVGAPLFAREIEQGTHVLAFTQSVSRTRWMFSKLVIALVPALAALVALQWLVSWWLTAAGVLGPLVNGPFNSVNFGIEHVSPTGYALFAFALGTFIGVLSRRTLVAMTAGLGIFAISRFALSGVPHRMIAAQRVETGSGTALPVHTDGSLVLSQGYLDAARQPVPREKVLSVIQACKDAPGDSQEAYVQCLPQSGLTTSYATYIPESDAGKLHLADFAVFGVLAVVLLIGTAWVLRRQS
ncbi:ABC transporter permease [Lentzea sp. NPDC060358]|uniref:ABC transporter permease n=1 Tax=Lentzea sp. NPDC060358 TaxID=3347103 RepID=UPI003664DE34